jgi:hypothetical protein
MAAQQQRMTSLSAPTQEGGLQSLNVGALRKKAEEARVDKEAIERVGQALAGACERQLHRAALDCRIFVQEERATTGGSQITRGIAPRRCHPRHLGTLSSLFVKHDRENHAMRQTLSLS